MATETKPPVRTSRGYKNAAVEFSLDSHQHHTNSHRNAINHQLQLENYPLLKISNCTFKFKRQFWALRGFSGLFGALRGSKKSNKNN